MDQSDIDRQLITLEGDDGKPLLCRILGVFPFEGEEYALLTSSVEPNGEPVSDGPPVLMRIVEQGDQAVFQTIESEEEFERVMTFIKETAQEMDEERSSLRSAKLRLADTRA
jgi:hypothetical protein